MRPDRLGAALAAAAALALPATPPARLEAAFTADSAAPRSVALLRLWTPTHAARLQVLHAGVEPGHTTQRDVMRGVSVGRAAAVGAKPAGAVVRIRVGDWPSGLYVARVVDGGNVAYAPLVVRPRRIGAHRVLVVLPTYTWQAYNFRDDDGDGRADTWYAHRGSTVRLDRPFTDRGVPPHFRHYDLPFLHWVARTGKRCDFAADSDLDRIANGRALARAYDLVVFEGHHEYVTQREYDAIERYRDEGGNLMFLSANDFFWRVARDGNTLRRVDEWRRLGRPEASLIGVQYRANDKESRKGPWVARGNRFSPWVLAGTGLRPGDRFGSGGIEIDSRTPSSPRGLLALAQIPNLYGRGYTAQMTYYATAHGAKVFAAGAFGLVESVIEPDAPLPDPEARRTRPAAARMLENVWRRLATP